MKQIIYSILLLVSIHKYVICENDNIACVFRFFNIQSNDELKNIESTIKQYASYNEVEKIMGREAQGEFTEYSFNVNSYNTIKLLREELPYKNNNPNSKKLIYQEFSPKFITNFQTVTLEASMEITINFKISAGSELYYCIDPYKEISVPEENIDPLGNVSLPIQIVRDQKYIYAKSILAQVERYLRIDVETGQTEEIDKKIYFNWLKVDDKGIKDKQEFKIKPPSIV
ncbi:hypothetical protein BVX93_01010 [bacterium B13(2017)]|nr:hypothetical protein BVX93_01010 [bacterium B13(2017)]